MPLQVAYFSRMFQAVPQLMEVQKQAGGCFVSNRASTLAAARRLYPEVPMRQYRRWLGPLCAGRQVLADADVIVTGAPGYKVLSRFPARSCMVFHGTYMFLNRKALSQMRHFDLLCSIGPRMQRTIERYQDEFDLNCVQTGYLPFGNFPETTPEWRTRTLSGMGLDAGLPTLVYMPWGKPHGSWEAAAARILNETSDRYNLILRPHPSQGLTARRADRAGFRKLSAQCALRRNTLLDISVQPMEHLFALADLMITDGTSPAEESMFYDTPQLFVRTPHWMPERIRGYARDSDMDVEDMERYMTLFDCGATFDTQSHRPFTDAVDEALQSAGSYRQARHDYFSWVFGQRDRLAGQRVYQALQGLAAPESGHSHQVPDGHA